MTELAIRPEIIAVGQRTLEELATEANQRHEEAGKTMVSALEHVIACGQTLIEAKQLCMNQKISWKMWVAENIAFSYVTATRLMRLAQYKDHLPQEVNEPWIDARGRAVMPSVNKALTYISGLPKMVDSRTPASIGRGLDCDNAIEARRLSARGLPARDIAEILGIPQSTIWRYLNPERVRSYNRKAQKKARIREKEAAALKRENERKHTDALAKKHGGPISESWASVRRLAQRVEQARRQARGEKSKLALREAQHHLYLAEDNIKRALANWDLIS